ncbi:hypothetical protein S245_052094, partial [Arachis hypogaea]
GNSNKYPPLECWAHEFSIQNMECYPSLPFYETLSIEPISTIKDTNCTNNELSICRGNPDKALELGIINSRHEAFITSKLWCNNDHHDLVLPALKTTL